MSTKTISVNPDFFNVGGRKKTRKKLTHSLRTNFNSLQKNILKNKMIDKIKEFKRKKKKKKKLPEDIDKDDYDSAVDFMEEIIQKRKKKKNKKKQKFLEKQREQGQPPINLHQPPINLHQPPINLHQPTQSIVQPKAPRLKVEPIKINTLPNNNDLTNKLNTGIRKDPPYGILKNGTKQLYSKYKQTLQNNSTQPNPTINNPKNDIFVFTNKNNFGKQQSLNINRKDKLENLKDNYLTKKLKGTIKKNEKFKVKNKKIIKRFILGKNKQTKKVSILIKNKKTRRLINNDCNFLKKKKLKQIKSVLVKNALIKVGTQAPEKLLREMYINRYLAGDIRNSGGKNAEEILMHNWNSESS